jgi:demethylmenaquinone methyltransferase/2-methoxy-6-polyprenyl-1,4-benzoquinol methylase
LKKGEANRPADRDTLISAAENRAMFDRIAKNYDVANRALSLGMDKRWRRKAVAMLEPVAGGRYLDIGTGTGDLVFEIRRQAAGTSVDGIDPSMEMLAVAKNKVSGEGIAFFEADATALPMADEFYEGIVSGFCFRNIEHRQKALTEMLRVLKPGGKLVVLEATYPSNPLVRMGYRLYTPWVPMIGKMLGGGAAYQYLVDSIEDFPRAGSVMDMFRAAGFAEVKCKPLTFGTVSIFSGIKRLAR